MTRPDDIARRADDYWQAYNEPQMRRDRLREWGWIAARVIAVAALGAAVIWLVLHVAPKAAAAVAEPFAGRPW